MCGGGGGGQDYGRGPTYYENIERDQRAQAERDAKALRDENAATTAATRTKFDTALANSDPYGRGVATQYLQERGLPVDEGTVNSIMSSIRNSIPDLDPNPNKYFTREAIGRELDTVAQGTRDRLGNQINQTFAPGFERTLIADTADDPILESILGEQRGTASKIVDFNKARGLLNDTGYQQALNTLNTQGNTARSTLTGIGDSVLGKFRQNVSDIRGEAGQAASAYNYGGVAPDIGSYYSRAQSKAGTDLAGIEGSIRSALGTTNLFDAPVALQAGGTLQGPINLTTRPAGVIGPVAEDTTKKGRGLGSTGVF